MLAYGYHRRVTHDTIARSRDRTHAAMADLAGREVAVYDPMIATARAMDRAEQAAADAIDEHERCLDAARGVGAKP